MDKYLNFQVENAEILNMEDNSEFLTASIDAFATGISRNDTVCDLTSLQLSAPTIFEKPILFTIDPKFGDFYTHVSPDKTLIAGFVIPNSAIFKEDRDRTILNVQAKIWSRYARKFIDVFKQDGNTKKVSVEVRLLDSEEEPNGLTRMKNWIFSGICVLSDLITEASPGANIVLNFAEENEKYKKAVALEFGKYEDIDMSIPENVKKNVNKGLALYNEYGRGATSISLASARFIAKNTNATPEKIRHITKTHKSNKFKNMIKSPPSDNWITYMLYGGKDGMEWSMDIFNKLEEQDKQQLSYFEEEITFPYKSVGDANPALKGIDPPLSLSQMNQIAAQADAIGSDNKKNGWAIAISLFKKTHEVKDEHWVKKEKNMEDEKDLKKPEEDMAASPPEEKDKEEEMATESKDEITEDKKEEMAVNPEKEEGKEEKDKKDDKEESPAEEKVEDDKEAKDDKEEKESKEKNMSLDENLDVKAILALLINETDAYKKLTSDFESGKMDMAEFMSQVYCKMCKMSEDNETFSKENEELKSFKSDVEKQKFSFEVQTTMKNIEEHSDMPQEKKDFLLEESKKFSLETIDAWKNLAQSEAFSFAIKDKEEDKELRFANPWGTKTANKKSSLWD